jgi:flagellin
VSTVINTNMASLFAQNSLANAQNNLATSVQRLSSGLRINSAKDDAAGLAISQNMQGQINGTNQSIRNLSNATNLLQTADSSLATIQDMLLRLKQLAVQGYDGSLSASQKLDIVNEMKDLNDEINATASRTAFNGIDLLASGAYVSKTGSDLRAGDDLITTAVAVSTSSGTIGAAGTNLVTMGTATVYDVDLASDSKNLIAGQVFTFTNSGNQLTMAGTLNGVATSQTVTVGDYTGNGTVRSEAAVLDFDQFGVSFNLTTSLAASYATQLGSAIAASFTAKSRLQIDGKVATVSDIRLNGAESGTFTMSAASGVVEMSGTLNGSLTTEKVTLTALTNNTTNTIEFKTFGVKFDVKAYAVDYDATAVGAALVAANVSGGTAGQLVINNGGNTTLDFQSGANSSEYIQINTLNVMTGDSGSTKGTNDNMTQVGSSITGTSSGELGDLSTTDTIATWQTAFQNAETAIDNALDYISTQRGIFGSQMNRLGYISTNLTSQSTNLQNSRSAIIDTDFASETAKLTKGQIMQQAATAMLAQANQMPNVVLSLLK